jgi:hypothetical protein
LNVACLADPVGLSFPATLPDVLEPATLGPSASSTIA